MQSLLFVQMQTNGLSPTVAIDKTASGDKRDVNVTLMHVWREPTSKYKIGQEICHLRRRYKPTSRSSYSARPSETRHGCIT